MCLHLTIKNQVNIGSLKKRTAPAPPPGGIIYGTLPHAPRHSQNLDLSDTYTPGNQKQSEHYGTLPLSRSNETKNNHQTPTYHFDNKIYERFEPLMGTTPHFKMDRQRYDTNDHNNLTTFTGHKRSPSSDSIGRNLQLGKTQ